MTSSCEYLSQFPPNDLIVHALGHGNNKLAAHLEVCPDCRSEVELFQSILTAVRRALNETMPSVQVRLMDCRPTHHQHYEALDSLEGVNLTLKRGSDCVEGQILDWPQLAYCWPKATVRLFGRQGLVSTSKIDPEGHFRLGKVVDGEQYSLGLVFSHEQAAELRIVGEVAS